MADLKPCPFCGNSVAVLDCQMDLAVVLCPQEPGGCGAEGGFGETTEAAAAAWNTRAPCPECDRQRERANEAVSRAEFLRLQLEQRYSLHIELAKALGVADKPVEQQIKLALARVAALEAVAGAARAFRDETNALLRAALGGQRPAIKATSYQDICAALAALDAKPQQGQPVGGKEQ